MNKLDLEVRYWNCTDKFIFLTKQWNLVNRLLTLICMISNVNLGVGEMGFMFRSLQVFLK